VFREQTGSVFVPNVIGSAPEERRMSMNREPRATFFENRGPT